MRTTGGSKQFSMGADVERAVAMARRIDAGATNVNAHATMDGLSAGGVKQSGIGRNLALKVSGSLRHIASMPKGALS